MKLNRGSTLGGTILVIAILAALSAALANLCVTHLRLSTRADNGYHASNLARSTIAAAMARLAETPEFGTDDGPPERTISVNSPQGTGFLSFSKSDADDATFPQSTNNIGNTESVTNSQGLSIAGDTVHLVARGVCNGVERRVETVIKVPSYPWAVAATGNVEITSGATVGALPEGVWPPSEDQLEPADLVSNSNSPTSIVLNGTCRVLGDVESPGGILVNGDGVTVEGKVKQGGQPSDIPSLDAQDYDPQAKGLDFDNLDSLGAGATLSSAAGAAPTAGLQLNGAARRSTDMTIDGNLVLNAASLYVDGDLTVQGNVIGYGVLVVTGDIIVNSGVALEGATQLAVLAGGTVTMKGVGPSKTAVRGMFYAGRGVSAKEMTVVGALIGGGEQANVHLDNVAVYNQEPLNYSDIDPITITTTPAKGKEVKYLFAGQKPKTSAPKPTTTTLAGATQTVTTTPTMANGPSNFISVRERMKVVNWLEL